MDTAPVRVRFAPSPTGYMHVGGARTALFNYLYARNRGGTFILRIEDTDRNRYQEGAVEEIVTSLQWLGLQWDEGPVVGGPHQPYVQSERKELYERHAYELLDRGKAYRCFCSAEKLQRQREAAEASNTVNIAGYDKTCRNLSEEQIQTKLSQQIPFVIRFKIPQSRTITFLDQIRGEIEYSTDVLDDLVLLKSDGFPTYHLANVVDDHTMAITHVLRGDEWIASTPRHILIYEALGWEPPQFAHLPVILSETGGKLSKRKGAASVMDYKKAGFLPEALANFLALLGWASGDTREIMPIEEISKIFTIDRISPKSSVFDEKKLEWMNGYYLKERSVESITPDIIALWKEYGIIADGQALESGYVRVVLTLLKDRSKRLTELAQSASYFFNDPQQYTEKAAKKYFSEGSSEVLRVLLEQLKSIDPFTHDAIEVVYRVHAESNAVNASKLIHPTRLALSGIDYGP
ncbi:MAG: glutamate--tRNA ligase, partial [Chitinivibrionales bacterium]|nr:glutamate--tRNA ligase [Chitinivibrionales bacterium]